MSSKILLTGATGFIGAHVLKMLVQDGQVPPMSTSTSNQIESDSFHRHTVVCAVRSEAKGRDVQRSYPTDKVSYGIVEDITRDGAFDKIVRSDPPFNAVIHAASPFHFKSKDFQREMLDPAVKGTVGILASIKAHAPSVRRVVITSSMAAVLCWEKPHAEYKEVTWNPITQEEAVQDPLHAYLGSKTFAERAAWAFVRDEKPNFSVATINPPAVFGPPIHNFGSLDNINTSNGTFADIVRGKWAEVVPESSRTQWVDVRDVALGHVRALEAEEAAGRRFIMVAGYASNAEMASLIKERNFKVHVKLPEDVGKTLEGLAQPVDTAPAQEILGISFTSLGDSAADTLVALAPMAA